MKRIFTFILTICFCFMFTSCSSAGGITTFTVAVEEISTNFDPQIAKTSQDLIAVINIFDGLFEKIDGDVVPVLAESYDISSDGRVYTIKINPNSVYHYSGKKSIQEKFNNKPVTAHDFVFAINRTLDPKTHSPYISDFSNVSHISAKDDQTLIIKLNNPDYNFTEKLCLPAAFPCNEEFFKTTGGAYGLSVKNILSNGPFRLNYIDQENGNATIVRCDGNKEGINRIRIKKIESSMQADAYINDEISGFFSYSSKKEDFDKTNVISYNSSNISLVFNLEKDVFSNENIRKSLAWYAFGFENSGANLDAVESCKTIFPDTITLSGEYINKIILPTRPTYMDENSKNYLQLGLSELGISRLESITILMPNDSVYSLIYENINQLWQKHLGQFFTVEYLPTSQIKSRLKKSDFDIAFLPLTPENDTPYGVLDKFSNYNDEVQNQINIAKLKSNQYDAKSNIDYAQNIILQTALTVPMGSEKTLFYYKNYYENIFVDPFNGVVNLKHTTAK